MHTARQLDRRQFAVSYDGAPATREDLLPGWGPLDRLGVVVKEPFGAVGAGHLVQLAITAFYDCVPDRRNSRVDGLDPTAVYPEIYLLHVGGPHGDHSAFDFWPSRKEVLLPPDPRAVLDAINDRGITRLAVPEGPRSAVAHDYQEPAAARERIRDAFVYAAAGRVERPQWAISGLDPVTEANARMILDPDLRLAAAAGYEPYADAGLQERSWPARTVARSDEAVDGIVLARQRRDSLRGEDGLVTETYRSIPVDEALEMLG